jgi:methyl-accepting chemotaxis protein
MRKLSLQLKLAVGFGSLLIVLLIVGTAGYLTLNKVNGLSEKALALESSVALWHDISANISEQKAALQAFVQDSTRKNELDQYAENGHRLEADFTALSPLVTTEKGKQMVAQFRSDLSAYRSVMDQMITLAQSSKNTEAAALPYAPESLALRDKYSKELLALSGRGEQLAQAAGKEEQVAESWAKTEVAIFVLVGVVIGIIMTISISHNVTRRVAQMLVTMKAIAMRDLSSEDMVIHDKDEIGQAGLILNEMKNNLRHMIHSVAENAELVASAATELAASSQQLSGHANAQRNQSQQVATAVHQMAAAIEEVSSSASRAAQEAQEARQQAHKGGEVVTKTVTAMNDLDQASRGTSLQIEELAHSSTEIGKVISVISEIAEQTNLLALNAAIEAARAGEQGRGFAVVAGEVRRLAERTGQATQEIGRMITAIQAEAQKAVDSITAEITQVNESTEAASRAGSALQGIIQSSENVKDMISQIATSSTQQAAATEEVNRSMAEIARLIDLSAAGTQDSAKASNELSRLAINLQDLVSQFRVEDRGAASMTRSPKAINQLEWNHAVS